MSLIESALEKYCVDCGGMLPTEKQGLAALTETPMKGPIPRGWRGPYVQDEEVLKDGWGRPFKYVCPGGPVEANSSIMRPYDLASYGRDGCEGGQGLDRDISSWDRATMVP
jgi:general secretion pathway protein G